MSSDCLSCGLDIGVFSFLFFSFPLLLVQGLCDGAPAGERRMEGGERKALSYASGFL